MGHDIWVWFDLLESPYFRARYIQRDQVHARDQNGKKIMQKWHFFQIVILYSKHG